ncbi:MAG: hypothetical protein EOP09_18435 [Proteobacteria bacterium]|nr:MAG: hypothetical protein EOP09_18435 [Pseudomonadota bacterium]
MKEFVLKNLPGIEDGAYFDLPKDFQGDRLGWLGGAYFGRGESANHLLDLGFLREDFPEEFRRERSAYLTSIGYINRLK